MNGTLIVKYVVTAENAAAAADPGACAVPEAHGSAVGSQVCGPGSATAR